MTQSYLAAVCHGLGLNFVGHDKQPNTENDRQSTAFNVGSNAEHESLLAQILGETERPDLAVLVGKAAAVTPTHLGYFTFNSAMNLRQAIDRLIKYYPVLEPSHARLSHNVQNGFIRFEWQGSAQYAAVHSGIQMVQLVQMARLTTRTEIMPKIVSFAVDVDPAVVASYRAFFGVDVIFDGGFYMAFSAADLDRKFAHFDQSIWKTIETDIDQRLLLHLDQMPIDQRVCRAIEVLLSKGPVSIGDVAAYLAIGRRTLQRRLKQGNVQFGDLLDQVRLELAKQYLQSNLPSRASLAYQLGFEDPNSFYRLYRQWVADGKLP